jgi:beta-aspartyl-dipeptidase (metallo-type)
MLDPLLEIAAGTEVGLDRFLPTHLNRTAGLLKSGIDYALKGGWIDFSTGIDVLERGAPVTPAARAAVEAREAGVPLERVTFSTDGNGVYTFFDDAGNVSRMVRWPVSAQWKHTRSLVQDHGWPLEEALAPVTTNPARVLGIPKGTIEAGRDADILALDADLNVKTVYAKGRCLVRDGEPLVRGLFEQDVLA